MGLSNPAARGTDFQIRYSLLTCVRIEIAGDCWHMEISDFISDFFPCGVIAMPKCPMAAVDFINIAGSLLY
jgi:hypothetical protein